MPNSLKMVPNTPNTLNAPIAQNEKFSQLSRSTFSNISLPFNGFASPDVSFANPQPYYINKNRNNEDKGPLSFQSSQSYEKPING